MMYFPRITEKQQQHLTDKQERILLVDSFLISIHYHIVPTLCLLAAMGLARLLRWEVWTELWLLAYMIHPKAHVLAQFALGILT